MIWCVLRNKPILVTQLGRWTRERFRLMNCFSRPAFAVILLFASLGVSAQSKGSAEIRRIDALAKSTDREVNKAIKVIVADVADFDKDKAEWKLFGSEQELEKFREKTETYTTALNWKRNGKLIATNLTLSSPSGDWSKFLFHYFRPDGSLALVRSELRTFYGDYVVKESRYFDRQGRLIRKSIKYFDLISGKPKKPTRELREDKPSFYKVDYFVNARKLPFAELILIQGH
jgi:hypothetical protein